MCAVASILPNGAGMAKLRSDVERVGADQDLPDPEYVFASPSDDLQRVGITAGVERSVGLGDVDGDGAVRRVGLGEMGNYDLPSLPTPTT
jgi:hypothetical protein